MLLSTWRRKPIRIRFTTFPYTLSSSKPPGNCKCPKGIKIISRRCNLRANGDQGSISGDPEGVERTLFNPFGVGRPEVHIFSVGFTYG
jgi:hypothetical protein